MGGSNTLQVKIGSRKLQDLCAYVVVVGTVGWMGGRDSGLATHSSVRLGVSDQSSVHNTPGGQNSCSGYSYIYPLCSQGYEQLSSPFPPGSVFPTSPFMYTSHYNRITVMKYFVLIWPFVWLSNLNLIILRDHFWWSSLRCKGVSFICSGVTWVLIHTLSSSTLCMFSWRPRVQWRIYKPA